MFRSFFIHWRPIKEVTPAQALAQSPKQRGQVIDVRNPQEFAKGHLKEAINLPLAQIGHYQGDKKLPVTLVCQMGKRSKEAAKVLAATGYKVQSIQGGMNALQAQGITSLES